MTLMLTLTKRDRKKRIPLYRKISDTRALSVFFKIRSKGHAAAHRVNFLFGMSLYAKTFFLACRLNGKFDFKCILSKKKF